MGTFTYWYGCNNISEMEAHCVSIKNEHEAGTMCFKGALTHFFATRQQPMWVAAMGTNIA